MKHHVADIFFLGRNLLGDLRRGATLKTALGRFVPLPIHLQEIDHSDLVRDSAYICVYLACYRRN